MESESPLSAACQIWPDRKKWLVFPTDLVLRALVEPALRKALDQENPPYTSTVLGFVGGGSVNVLRMRDLAEA